MELPNSLECVKDEESFLVFVKSLLSEQSDGFELGRNNKLDDLGETTNGWENITLKDFFEGAIAWAEDSKFGENQGINNNHWYKFAVFLYCGKIYE
jgi:hypothetical protein